MAKEKKGEKLNLHERNKQTTFYTTKEVYREISPQFLMRITIIIVFYRKKSITSLGGGDLYKIIPPPPYGYITL